MGSVVQLYGAASGAFRGHVRARDRLRTDALKPATDTVFPVKYMVSSIRNNMY